MSGFLQWLAAQVSPISIILGFYLALFCGKQGDYLGRAILRPDQLVRGRMLCPECLGSGVSGGDTVINVSGYTCLFCLRAAQLHPGTPSGFVPFRYFWREWDKRRWRQSVGVARVPGGGDVRR